MAEEGRDAEVGDLGLHTASRFVLEQAVRQLQVSVRDPLIVGFLKAKGDLHVTKESQAVPQLRQGARRLGTGGELCLFDSTLSSTHTAPNA